MQRLRRGDPGATERLPRRTRYRDCRSRPRGGIPRAHQRRWRRSGRRASWAREGGRLMPLLYVRYELLRTLRNRRFFVLSLGFPLVLYFVIAAPNRNVADIAGSG